MLRFHLNSNIAYTASIGKFHRFLLRWEFSEMQYFSVIIELLSISFSYSGKIVIMGFFILGAVGDISMLSIYSEVKFILSKSFPDHMVSNTIQAYRLTTTKTLNMRCCIQKYRWTISF